ncbi:MAG: IPExxxVDY family protein [Flavobacteriales bacterium]|nr:IPExxxVDY family protein [Flavobacteriales bacterium]HRH69070.1 IPExxxVDY family protein [Flavobacteriales bacterium]
MAKLKLDLEPDPAVTVIGISSHVHDYRLCWSINRSVGLELTRRRTDIAEEINGVTARYSTYDHVDEATQTRFTLVNNHSGDGILLKEHRQADFFLVVDNELAENTPDLLDRVRRADFVLTAFPLSFEQLRAGHKLLL